MYIMYGLCTYDPRRCIFFDAQEVYVTDLHIGAMSTGKCVFSHSFHFLCARHQCRQDTLNVSMKNIPTVTFFRSGLLSCSNHDCFFFGTVWNTPFHSTQLVVVLESPRAKMKAVSAMHAETTPKLNMNKSQRTSSTNSQPWTCTHLVQATSAK